MVSDWFLLVFIGDIVVVVIYVFSFLESQEGTFPDACIATNFSLNENGDIM